MKTKIPVFGIALITMFFSLSALNTNAQLTANANIELTQTNEDPSVKPNCTAKCDDGECTVTCGEATNAHCNCNEFTGVGGVTLELPSCWCGSIMYNPGGAVMVREGIMITATDAQLARIESFKQSVLKSGRPIYLAKEIAGYLDVIQKSFKCNQVSVYRAALVNLNDNFGRLTFR